MKRSQSAELLRDPLPPRPSPLSTPPPPPPAAATAARRDLITTTKIRPSFPTVPDVALTELTKRRKLLQTPPVVAAVAEKEH